MIEILNGVTDLPRTTEMSRPLPRMLSARLPVLISFKSLKIKVKMPRGRSLVAHLVSSYMQVVGPLEDAARDPADLNQDHLDLGLI